MRNKILAACAALVLAACGGLHNYVDHAPGDLSKSRQISVGTVAVQSKEDNPDARSLNNEWKLVLTDQLQTLLRDKGRLAAKPSKTRVDAKVDVVYGSQALRYWVGFGAGSGSIKVTLELKDAAGAVVYATRTEAKLSAGWFGGDMKEVTRKALQTSVSEFGKRL